jgi:hypothetical protein
MGKCRVCGRPAVTKNHCEKHREHHLARSRARLWPAWRTGFLRPSTIGRRVSKSNFLTRRAALSKFRDLMHNSVGRTATPRP